MIASLGNTEIFSSDLWGGTPFNQASNLINENKRAVTGQCRRTNWPMVIE
ncbi:PTS sugar transporter subunit IIA domain-containing protein [Limosilactobacillus fermentum]